MSKCTRAFSLQTLNRLINQLIYRTVRIIWSQNLQKASIRGHSKLCVNQRFLKKKYFSSIKITLPMSEQLALTYFRPIFHGTIWASNDGVFLYNIWKTLNIPKLQTIDIEEKMNMTIQHAIRIWRRSELSNRVWKFF